MRTYDVYIVRCSDGSYYTGITNDVERRIGEHNAGVDPKSYTFRRRPVRLVYVADFWDVNQAIAWEKIVKRWSRTKKEALIRGEYERLPELAVCTNGTHYYHFRVITCHAERSRSATCDLLFRPSTTLGMTQK
ncbi:GIY-YIG nuclease family protein [Candidatus Peribacteria bacterium]|nr:GIY-YIG nuclease family protein [Candidatus Peribacteria bacterium]